jgi:hypothetical protein
VGTLLVDRSIAVFKDFREGQVLIKTELATHQNQLLVLAYTFREYEFDELEVILRRSEIEPRYSPIEADRYGRAGRRYYVALDDTPRLGASLGGDFDSVGQFVPHPTVSGGRNYACEEMRAGGRNGKGCQNLAACRTEVCALWDKRTGAVRFHGFGGALC